MKKIFVIIVLLLLCGCTNSKNNILSVNLEGNPTTGYNWVYTISNSKVIEPKNTIYKTDDEKLIGSGGVYTYTFNVLGDGSATINFKYLREWESEPIYNIKYEVEVKNGKIKIIDSTGIYLNNKIPELKINKGK